MAATRSDEFKRDAVRIALTSGLTRRQVASDLGIGLSTLGKWVRVVCDEARAPGRDADLLRESERLRKENRILRDLSRRRKQPEDCFPAKVGGAKKGGSVLRGSKAMRFQVIANCRGSMTRSRLCRLMGVTDRGLRAWKHRPPSPRQRRDMVLLAHIRDQHRSGLGSYGRPRMTEELKELGLRVGQRRVGRLMRENGIRIVRSRKFKRTTDSDHAFNVAPNPLQQDFTARGPNRKWAGDITCVWTREGWVCLAGILDLFSRRVVGWALSNRMKQVSRSGR